MVNNDTVKIPVTVEDMGNQIKILADKYIKGDLSYPLILADLNFLKVKRNDLFVSALAVRWLGKKRLKLVQSILGDI
jgi:hypothetical protein